MKLHLTAILLASALFLPGCGLKTSNTLNTSSSSPVNSTLVSSTDVAQQPRASLTKNWYSYTSQDGKYTVLFPTKPKETTQFQNTAAGNVKFITVVYENQQQNIAYLATSTKYSRKFPTSKLQSILDSARDGQLEGGNATLISENQITMNGFSGREVLAYSSKENLYYRTKIFFDTTNSTLYQLVAASEKADTTSEETIAFLDSLTIKS